MAKGYSDDLRERVVAALQRGGLTDEAVAKLFQIGEATVHRWKRLKRETGGTLSTLATYSNLDATSGFAYVSKSIDCDY